MNLDELLRKAHTTVAPAPAQGRLFVVRCIPDPFTGETLNIGVCGVAANGQRLAKVITEPGRLKCLYGESAATVVNLAASALYCLERGLPSPSPQVHFDEPQPFYNSTLEQAVNDAFADQVTVALPHRENNTAQITDDMALKSVRKLLLETMGLAANALLPEEPVVMVPRDEGGGSAQMLRIPIRAAYGYAALRSSDFGAGTVRQHLLESFVDLTCAGRYRQRQLRANQAPSLAIFVMHNPDAARSRRVEMERVIDDIAPRAAGLVEVLPALGPADMATIIGRWGEEHSIPPKASHH